MKKIIIPEGMLKAAVKAWGDEDCSHRLLPVAAEQMLEAALRWLSENPIVPTNKECWEIGNNSLTASPEFMRLFIIEWQRRIFLVPEPEVPEEIKDLLEPELTSEDGSISPEKTNLLISVAQKNRDVIEAFHRGQRSKE